jgi:hypothetical protein
MPIYLREPNPVAAAYLPPHLKLIKPQHHEDKADEYHHARRPPIPRELAREWFVFGSIVAPNFLREIDAVIEIGFPPARAFVGSALRARSCSRWDICATVGALWGS